MGPHRLPPELKLHSDLNSSCNSSRSVTFTSLNDAGEPSGITKQNYPRRGDNFSSGDFSGGFPTFSRNLSDSFNSQRSDTSSTLNFNTSGHEGSLAALSTDWEGGKITVHIDEGPLPSMDNTRGLRETSVNRKLLIPV